MRRRAAFVLAGLSALCGASCLPDPAPRATVSITLRGGDRHLVSEDGFTVDLERRVIVGGVSTSTSIAGGSSGGAYVRDLDTAPFELPDIRAKSSRYVVAYVTSYYDRRERGPGSARPQGKGRGTVGYEQTGQGDVHLGSGACVIGCVGEH